MLKKKYSAKKIQIVIILVGFIAIMGTIFLGVMKEENNISGQAIAADCIELTDTNDDPYVRGEVQRGSTSFLDYCRQVNGVEYVYQYRCEENIVKPSKVPCECNYDEGVCIDENNNNEESSSNNEINNQLKECMPVTNSLIHWWDPDNAPLEIRTIYDLASERYDFSHGGDISQGADNGNAFQVSGSWSLESLNAQYSLQDSFSIVARFKVDSLGLFQTIIASWKEVENKRSFSLIVTPEGDLRFDTSPDGLYHEGNTVHAETRIQPGQWYNVVASHYSTGNSIEVGNSYRNSITHSSPGVYSQGYLYTYIGNSEFADSTAPFNGIIDEIQIYSPVLEQWDRLALHNGLREGLAFCR